MSITWVNICKVLRTVPGIQWVLCLLATIIFLFLKVPTRVPWKVLGYTTLAKVSLIKPSVGKCIGKQSLLMEMQMIQPLEATVQYVYILTHQVHF